MLHVTFYFYILCLSFDVSQVLYPFHSELRMHGQRRDATDEGTQWQRQRLLKFMSRGERKFENARFKKLSFSLTAKATRGLHFGWSAPFSGMSPSHFGTFEDSSVSVAIMMALPREATNTHTHSFFGSLFFGICFFLLCKDKIGTFW